MYRPVNPGYTADELRYALELTGASLVVTSSASVEVAVAAARSSGIPSDRVVIIDTPSASQKAHASVEELVSAGLAIQPAFVERRLLPGEGKTKVAFLCFSSGTTGRPKAVAVSHYAMIANVIQVRGSFVKAPRYGSDDVVLGGPYRKII